MSAVKAVTAVLRAQATVVRQQYAVALDVIRRWTAARDALRDATRGAGSPVVEHSVSALTDGIEALECAAEHLRAVPKHLAVSAFAGWLVRINQTLPFLHRQ